MSLKVAIPKLKINKNLANFFPQLLIRYFPSVYFTNCTRAVVSVYVGVKGMGRHSPPQTYFPLLTTYYIIPREASDYPNIGLTGRISLDAGR